jgi:hypothetical protein
VQAVDGLRDVGHLDLFRVRLKMSKVIAVCRASRRVIVWLRM